MFKALLVEKTDSGTSASVQELDESRLPEGDVTVAVEHSTLNYKDGLCIGPGGGLVRTYPHVPGIDFAGTVEASDDARFAPGDKVILTGWGVGERHWGGYAQKARVSADWLVPLPEGMTTRQAMALGTAGFTAMMAIRALEAQGLTQGELPVLVTGASGGVGSVAVALLSRAGHKVAAVTGRPEQEGYLRSLGATEIVAREELAEVTRKPLEHERWAAAVDNVGGAMLARLLGQVVAGGSVAAIGLAGGAEVPMKVTPFLLRGINLLGINSVYVPVDERRAIWARLAADMDMALLEEISVSATLADLPRLGAEILKGQVRGRVVVDVNG
ncbi:MDR family oxidoreductase [Pseudoroseicyclus sp. CXY001]|uniref:MDR family oxidoreductase n=1 Tax=Pseudoroseicyclus sp. CXY001 TaxID=3242492 RepID=UPI003571762C